MSKYMVIVLGDGKTTAKFFDNYNEAENYRSIAECSLGFYAEIYERVNGEYTAI